jgi:Eukaryotic mitochondrial regulator protein
MYSAYMADPVKNNVRALAQSYGMSLKRVDAILRLKGLERDWLKVSSPFPFFSLMRYNRLVFKTHNASWLHFNSF